MPGPGDAPATPDTRPQIFLREALVDGRWQMRSFRTAEGLADGTILEPDDDTPLPEDAYETWNTRIVDGRLVIWVNPERAPRAPDLWYCAVFDASGERPAVNIVAFASDDVAPGTVVPDTEFFALPVRSDEQVAAVRVFTDDGEVDQIYVASEYRRLHVAAKLIRVASAFHMAHGWNGLLHDTGRRTDLGEELGAVFTRVAERRERMPPMDPPENLPPSA